MSSTVNRTMFFLMLGFFFIVFFYATGYFYSKTDSGSTWSRGAIISTSAIVFSLFFVGYTQLTGVLKTEGFNYCPSPSSKLCRGGSYFWQGDSERSKFCRSLASTPKGLAEINSRECGKGMVGIPGNGFRDTPMSNGCWKNELCDSASGCNIRDNGIF
jgi:hypothetical protein